MALSARGKTDFGAFQGYALSPKEFRKEMKQHFGVDLTMSESVAVVKHFDRDGDGHLDYKEIMYYMLHPERLTLEEPEDDDFSKIMTSVRQMAISHARARGMKPGKKFDLKSIFDAIDVDGNGTVSRDEFRKALRLMNIRLTKRQLGICFEALDPDGSGAINYYEFAWAFYNRRKAANAGRRKVSGRGMGREDPSPSDGMECRCNRLQ